MRLVRALSAFALRQALISQARVQPLISVSDVLLGVTHKRGGRAGSCAVRAESTIPDPLVSSVIHIKHITFLGAYSRAGGGGARHARQARGPGRRPNPHYHL